MAKVADHVVGSSLGCLLLTETRTGVLDRMHELLREQLTQRKQFCVLHLPSKCVRGPHIAVASSVRPS